MLVHEVHHNAVTASKANARKLVRCRERLKDSGCCTSYGRRMTNMQNWTTSTGVAATASVASNSPAAATASSAALLLLLATTTGATTLGTE